MKKGDMVKYKEPIDINEEDEPFVVLEDRGDRLLVASLFIDLSFGATTVLRTDDLTIAIPYEEGKVTGLADSVKAEPFLTISPYPAGTQERLDWNRGYQESLYHVGTDSAGKGQSCE
jgi:hypothetical protein